MTPQRLQRFTEVVKRRQPDFTVILENVHDPHNIAAVLRSCDSVGITEIYVLFTEQGLTPERIKMGKRSSAGAKRWVEVNLFDDLQHCFTVVRKKYKRILSAHLDDQAENLFDLELSGPVALLFGNEHDGVSEEANGMADGSFIIPQQGMVQSLNISVACAVTLYEAMRQRLRAGRYGTDTPLSPGQQHLLATYIERHQDKSSPPVHRFDRRK